MRNQITYLENRCDQLKRDLNDVTKSSKEQIERKLIDRNQELNKEVDLRKKEKDEQTRE